MEYKTELQKQIEEKRRINEPLNKEARDKLLPVYAPENLQYVVVVVVVVDTIYYRENPELKERVQKNPELTLINLDPKVILSKHQNDFQQVRSHRLPKGVAKPELLNFV